MTRVAIYVRVSTTEQTTLNQTQILTQIAEKNQWIITSTYEDNGISGTKGRDKRPAFDKLCNDMSNREFDRILVWDISRLGRSLKNLVEFLHDVHKTECELYVHQSGLDTSTPAGKMMFQMVGVFSEFERSMISERVKLGLQRVKQSGKRLGRPTKITKDMTTQIFDLKIQHLTHRQIAVTLGISQMSVSRSLRNTSFVTTEQNRIGVK